MALSYTSKNNSSKTTRRARHAAVPKSAKLLLTALITLLNWSNLDLSAPSPRDWIIVASSVAAILLLRRGLRAGLWIATALGVGFFAFTTSALPGAQIVSSRPIVLSTFALFSTGVVMLWHTRERSQSKDTEYERHAQF